MNNTAMLVIVTFDCDLMEHFDAKSFNEFTEKLVRRGMTPIAWSKGKRPSPIGVAFDFRGWRCVCRRLEGIDLTFCDLEGAEFAGTNLQGAKIGSCPGANFRNSWLDQASFRGNISGCCFEPDGIDLPDADFSQAYYSAGHAPTGLPPEVLATCEVVPNAPDDPDWPPVIVERHVKARATVHEVPW